MQKETLVKSYVRRSHKQEAETSTPYMALIVGGSIIVLMAVVYIQITLVLGLFLGAAYGLRTALASSPRADYVEAVVEPVSAPEKPKRHYEHRLRVTHYATGKTIRV